MHLRAAFVSILCLVLAASSASSGPDVGGAWQGALEVQGMKLRLVLHLTPSAAGSLTATLDSPDQGAEGIPMDEVVLEGDRVRVASTKLQAAFEGNLSSDGSRMEGNWNQGGLSLPLVLERGSAPARRRPQTPAKPFPYETQEVSYDSAAPGVTLAGTLTLPRGDGPYAAVLLISGSGAQDRDETIFEHKPFLVLADHLTRRGIAVLRVDDRGVGGSSGPAQSATSADFAADVRGGVAFLKQHAKIDAKHIGLAGHSEGGLIAPMVAAESRDIAFLVLIAAPGVPGEEILYEQGVLLARAGGTSEADIARNRALQKKLFTIAKRQSEPDVLRRDLQAAWKETVATWDEAARRSPGASETNMKAQIAMLVSPWMRYFLEYDPRPALHKVKCPVLAINGAKDLQVASKQNLGAIEAALVAGGHKDHTLRELPDLNHLLQTCTTGAATEYGEIEETMAPVALELIASWITDRTR